MTELDEATRLTTQPLIKPPVANPFRVAWRTLTSMRTALLLLFLLALASIPGGFLPQRAINPLRVNTYLAKHQSFGPLMDRVRLFDVFSSPWFSAIYLLLFVSLIGCLIPRTRLHLRALRARPPKVPRTLARLPVSDSFPLTRSPEEELDRAAKALRGWRLERRGNELSAEKGYLRETGNLVFHLSLVLLLIGIAIGAFLGFKGTALVVEGKGFSNTVGLYDDIHPGRRFQQSSLVPFTVDLKAFNATYAEDGKALTFDADVTWSKPGGREASYDIRVNHPLHIGAAKTYLVGHGYAPHLVFKDVDGTVLDDVTLPCLPQNPQFLSTCVLKEASTVGKQVGFRGVFTPTTVTDAGRRVASTYPGLRNPFLTVAAFEGSLGVDSGLPQSVFRLDTSAMTPIDSGRAHALAPGETWHLPSGTSLTYVDTREWATFQVTQDPGKGLALLASVGMVGGLMLSLFIRRRRMWVRVLPGTVEVGGLARTDPDRFAAEFAQIVSKMRE
jgi:cytochrome c biogenesis protein